MSILLLSFLISAVSLAQQQSRKELKYKPRNLDEALVQLDKWFSDSAKVNIKATSEEDFLRKSHVGIAMAIRNEWGLWKKRELTRYFQALGIFHPNDMSSIILRSYHRKLNDKELAVKEQVSDIQLFYKNMQDPQWRQQQEIEAWEKVMASYVVGDTLTNHVYYDRSKLNGKPRKNTVLTAVLIGKRERELKLDFISFGTEADPAVVFQELKCTQGDCWVGPRDWHKKKPKK